MIEILYQGFYLSKLQKLWKKRDKYKQVFWALLLINQAIELIIKLLSILNKFIPLLVGSLVVFILYQYYTGNSEIIATKPARNRTSNNSKKGEKNSTIKLLTPEFSPLSN